MFGFAVTKSELVDCADCWEVKLPFQHDEWFITSSTKEVSWGTACLRAAPHARAVEQLEQFVAEAQKALQALKAHEEMDDSPPFMPSARMTKK